MGQWRQVSLFLFFRRRNNLKMQQSQSSNSTNGPENRHFTEEQLERARRNKEEALRIRAEKERQRQQQQKMGAGASGEGKAGGGGGQKQQQQTGIGGGGNRPQWTPVPQWQRKPPYPLPNLPGPSSFSSSSVNPAHQPSSSSTLHIRIDFVLISATRFKVQFHPFHMDIVNKLKSIPSGSFNSEDKSWTVLFTHYELTKSGLKGLAPKVNVQIYEIPFGVRQLFFNKNPVKSTPNLAKIGQNLHDTLYPFQRSGVSFGVEKNGRLLVADEMGLGKSLQALGIANYYRTEWPLLIVCPSSVKYPWMSQVERFLPDANVYLIEKQSDPLPISRNTSVVMIISYDMMVAKKQEIKRNSIYVVIFDECHMLKEQKTQRTKVAFELSKIAHRVILLSGTPALSRPSELFTQIRLIDPRIFPNWREYAIRYCEGRQGPFGFEAKGRSNPEELKTVMEHIMIRRLKKDVLEELPEKRREIVYLSGDVIDSRMRELKKAKEACAKANQYSDEKTKRDTTLEYYVQTGLVKMKAVADHIVDSFFHEGAVPKKVLVFAHHLAVLDTVGIALAKVGVQFIRIDGTTPARDRACYCDQFQSDPRIMVALLSITAAGTGITLTAASVVVFAELYWNPSLMIQAEDRAHRVGQRDSVHVQYILARNTADHDLWRMVSSKLKVLGEVNLANETYRDAENTEKLCSTNKLITNFFEVMKNYEEKDGNPTLEEPEAKKIKALELGRDHSL